MSKMNILREFLGNTYPYLKDNVWEGLEGRIEIFDYFYSFNNRNYYNFDIIKKIFTKKFENINLSIDFKLKPTIIIGDKKDTRFRTWNLIRSVIYKDTPMEILQDYLETEL